MNTVGNLLTSMPADPRMAPGGGASQATTTSKGPAGATAQTSGFVQAGSNDGVTASPAKASTTTTTTSSSTGEPSLAESLLAGAEARLSSISAGLDKLLSGGAIAPSHGVDVVPILPASHSTSGFLNGVNPALRAGSAGGLASNPLVPRPGETIDPATGRPHQAGMTRAELEAKRAAAAAAAGAGIGASSAATLVGSSGSGTHLEDLSGREQAARQLTGTVPVAAPALPGTKIGAPVTSTGTTHHSVLEDVVDMLPQGLKERIAGVNDPKGKMSEAEREKRLSAQGILDAAKQQGGKIFQDLKETFHDGLAKGPTVFTQIPTTEELKARATEHSGGVGDLPGKSTEAGVAVVPDEKAAVEKNQGFAPGEVAPSTSGRSNDAAGASGVATRPTATGVASATSTPLAPPLPATTLGSGAAHGATDLDSLAGVSTSSSNSIASSPTGPNAQKLLAPGAAPTAERSTSMASVTAISRGHEGVRHSETSSSSSPLANQVTTAGQGDNDSKIAPAAAGAAALTGSLALKDSAPGRHEDGVGHPSTRGPETSREPGSYPKADLSGEADHHHSPKTMSSVGNASNVGQGSSAGTTDSKTSTTTGGLGPAGTVPADSDRPTTTGPIPQSPNTPDSSKTSGHDSKRRTSSGGSSKKKVGFMSKLKGEIKVISGKLDHDKEKVEAGKRMIHGE